MSIILEYACYKAVAYHNDLLFFPDENEDERKREQRKKDIETCFGFEEM